MASVSSQAEAAKDKTDPALLKKLKAMDELIAGVKDLSATFEQRRYSPLLKKPIVSSGKMRAMAGRSRWDTVKPFASVMAIQTDRLMIYYPEDAVLEVYPLEARLGELVASPMVRLSDWLKHFTLDPVEAKALSKSFRKSAGVDDPDRPSVLVRLTPRDKKLSERIPTLVVVIDEKTGLSRAMAWSGQEGEKTEIVYRAVQTNTELEEDDLALDVPKKTRVVYPLGPIKSKSESPQ